MSDRDPDSKNTSRDEKEVEVVNLIDQEEINNEKDGEKMIKILPSNICDNSIAQEMNSVNPNIDEESKEGEIQNNNNYYKNGKKVDPKSDEENENIRGDFEKSVVDNEEKQSIFKIFNYL